MDKILEKKKEVQKRRGGVDEKTIKEWKDIDRQNEQSRITYKTKQAWSWIKKYKVLSAIVTIIGVLILVFGFLFTYVIHGDVNIINGGEDITPESLDISENKGSWSITLKNDGFVPSNNIVLLVKFDDRVRINENTIVYVPVPDDEMLDDDKNELKYTWDILGSGKEIILTFDVTTPTSNIMTNEVPKYVQVKTGEEGLVYYYPPID